MASAVFQRFLMQQMSNAQKKRDQAAQTKQIAEIGQSLYGQREDLAPFENDQTFPGEAPIEGLQQGQVATGLFDTETPVNQRILELNQRRNESGIPLLQDRAGESMRALEANMLRSGRPTNPVSPRTFAMGAPDGKMQRAYIDQEGNTQALGEAYDPRNPYLDTGTEFVNPNNQYGNVSIQNRAKAKETAEGTAEVTTRNAALKEMDKQINTLGGNIRLYGEGMDKIDDGAITGYISNNFIPSFRQSTIELENIGNQLGLQVIQGVTFGALSAGEMKLAMETAMPKNAQPAALRKWLNDKKAAQTKLRKQLIRYRRFRSTNSQNDLYDLQERDAEKQNKRAVTDRSAADKILGL